MPMRLIRLSSLALMSLLAVVSSAAAGPFVLSTDKLSYGGTVTSPDGIGHVIPTSTNGANSTLDGRRDAGIYMTPGAVPTTGPVSGFSPYLNYNTFLTAWWYTDVANTNAKPLDDPDGDRYYSGWGNPNNTNTGFVQLYDADGSTRSVADGYWDSTRTVFTALVIGSMASFDDVARLWHAPNDGGASSLTRGTFTSYELLYQAVFSTPATDDGNGWFYQDTHPLSVSGHFRGEFLNDGTGYPGNYAFDLTFNAESWAHNRGDDALNGDFSGSFAAAQEVRPVPEPGTLVLLGLGLAAAGRKLRRR